MLDLTQFGELGTMKLRTMLEDAYDDGFADGKAKREAEERVKNLQQLMKNLGLTLDKAMSAIGIPLSELDFYRNLLAENK